MGIVLGANHYGKAEVRVVRVFRDQPRHQIRDLCVSTALRGDFADAHMTGDQAAVLPTDSQKNTVYARARTRPPGAIEDFALDLARHFVTGVPAVTGARVRVDEYAWDRIEVNGQGHDHAFVRRGQEVRTALVTVEAAGPGPRAWVVSGVRDLMLLKSTGSEFRGFYTDEYTTLAPAGDRILATRLAAAWRHATALPPDDGEAFGPAGPAADGAPGSGWDLSWSQARAALLGAFASTHSRALQQSLHAMGEAALTARPELAEIRFSAPNNHHFAVDLAPFGLDNPGEVFFAADRPYGLIEASVLRDDAPDAGPAWGSIPAFS